MSTFPIELRITEKAKGELHASEWGSWEDLWSEDPDHVVPVIEASPKGKLVIKNQQQADKVLYALSTGTFGLREKGFLPTCRRLYEELYPHASPEAQSQYHYPNGW